MSINFKKVCSWLNWNCFTYVQISYRQPPLLSCC